MLILVRWHDAWFDVDHEAEARPDYLVETVGYELGVDALYLHLAAERLPDGEGWRAITHIPVVCIEEVVTLEPVPSVALNGGRATARQGEDVR